MNNQITQYQNRLFYKLFATLPSIKKVKDFNMGSNFDFEVNSFYHIRNKDFGLQNLKMRINIFFYLVF